MALSECFPKEVGRGRCSEGYGADARELGQDGWEGALLAWERLGVSNLF